MDEMAELCAEFAPRRLALCALAPELDDGAVVGWGMAFDDRVFVYLPELAGGRRGLASFSSVERAMAHLGRYAGLRLIWIDPASPADQ
jgi:hypothetical protein